jgi:large subunit ribosomal protein L9
MVKVLFLQNVDNNKVGEVKSVPDGYARNLLFPKNLAVIATDEEIKTLEAKIEKMKAEEEKIVSTLNTLAEKIGNKTYKVEAQAGDEDKLFGSVTNRDLAEVLVKAGFEVEKQNIEILEPINTLGEHEAFVKLGHGIRVKIEVTVVRAA